MESKERAQLLENYSRKSYLLTKHLGQFPREMWGFKPDDEHWCIREILWHILDIEMHAYLRFRTAVAEPGKTVSAPEQETWARRLEYARMDVDDAIEGFVWVIKANGKFLKSRPAEDIAQAVVHPEYGTLDPDQLLERHNRHIQHHLDQMTKRYNEWKSLKK